MKNNANEVVTQKETQQCKPSEKIGHALGVLGHDATSTLRGTWITPFMTDILHLPALFLAIIVPAARIFDAFTDISMGVIADRTRSRWGRFRPWLIWAGPIYCLLTLLCFVKPGFGILGLCTFSGILYVLTGSIAFTAVDIPFWSLPAAMTNNTEERSGIIGTTTMASNVITGLIGIIMPLALNRLGARQWTSYFYVAAIIAVFGVIMYVCCFKMVREHVIPDDTKKFSLKLALQNIFSNQPLLCVQLSNIFCLLALILRGNFNYYYCMYNLGNLDIMAVMNTIGLIGSIVGSLLFISISKHVGKKKCLYALVTVYVVAHTVLYFAGWTNVAIIYICSTVSSLVGSAAMICVNAMMADTIEYGEWKTGQRNEALITSTRCFVTKVVSALSVFAVAAVLGLTGYTGNIDVQPISTLNSFHFMYSMFCSGVMILAVVPMFFYKLDEKRHAEIMEELAARKANRGDN